MGHLLLEPTSPIGKNIGLVFSRGAPLANEFSMIFVSDTIIDKGLTDTVHKAYFAPLYCHYEINGWTPNLAPEALV
jgi:hypothetical protein